MRSIVTISHCFLWAGSNPTKVHADKIVSHSFQPFLNILLTARSFSEIFVISCCNPQKNVVMGKSKAFFVSKVEHTADLWSWEMLPVGFCQVDASSPSQLSRHQKLWDLLKSCWSAWTPHGGRCSTELTGGIDTANSDFLIKLRKVINLGQSPCVESFSGKHSKAYEGV